MNDIAELTHLGGRHALVTGAANGLGRATATQLARAGAEVCVADLDGAAAEALSAELTEQGLAVWARRVDVTAPDDLRALMDSVAERSGGHLDALIANVGVMFSEDLEDVSIDAWNRCLELNLTSVMATFQAGLPLVERAPAGAMVAMSSGAGFNRTTLAGVAYASAKAGIAQLVRVLGERLGPRGIRVNAVAPGAADTQMTQDFGPDRVASLEARIPLRRLGTPEEVANTILFLVSPMASYVNGEILHVTGGT